MLEASGARCPFLLEEKVRYCLIAPVRKLLPVEAIDGAGELCGSSRFGECVLAQERLGAEARGSSCPFLQEADVLRCEASTTRRPIPQVEALTSRCTGDAHRYCALYRERAHPETPGGAGTGLGSPGEELIPVPAHLSYARNHMWIERGSDGGCHVGVDAFVARVLGEVESVTFVSGGGWVRPAVSLRVGGDDLAFVFPRRLRVRQENRRLRAHPELLHRDPYGEGWLFEGSDPTEPSGRGAADGFVGGDRAAVWMREEIDRLSRWVHARVGSAQKDAPVVLADGGHFEDGLARSLDREPLLELAHRFFAPDP